MGAVPFPAAGTEPIKGNASRSREIHHDRGSSLDRRPRLAVASFTPCAMIGTAAVALFARVMPSSSGELKEVEIKSMTRNGSGGTRHKLLTRCLAVLALFGVYCLGAIGVSGLVMSTTSTPAQARARGGVVRSGGIRSGGFRGGFRGRGGGRWWGGSWYGYGGPCWRWTPVGWVWTCY